MLGKHLLGIYEKALDAEDDWYQRMAKVLNCSAKGFSLRAQQRKGGTIIPGLLPKARNQNFFMDHDKNQPVGKEFLLIYAVKARKRRPISREMPC